MVTECDSFLNLTSALQEGEKRIPSFSLDFCRNSTCENSRRSRCLENLSKRGKHATGVWKKYMLKRIKKTGIYCKRKFNENRVHKVSIVGIYERKKEGVLFILSFFCLFVSWSTINLEKSDAHEKVIPHWKTFGIKIEN